MPHAGVYVLASFISGVSAALILAGGPSYTESRSPRGTVHDAKRGQSIYDGCLTSPCQVVYINSVEGFCLWAPSQPATRNTEHTLVAWCTKSVHGTRLIPDGTISGAHLVITPEYVQVTGVGNLTNINVPTEGVASASGEGDRVHGLVFTSVYGQLEQLYDWTSFVSQERFCFRACKPSAAASTACPQIYDIFGCLEYVPGNYDAGAFYDCTGNDIEVPSSLYQEVLAAPLHHSVYPSFSCTTRGTIADAQVTRARRAIAPIVVTSLSHRHLRSHSHSAPMTTDTATTTAFPSFPTSTLTATTFMNSSTPGSSNAPTFTPHSHNHPHRYSHTPGISYHYTSTSSAATSASPSSSHHSFSHSPSSSSTATSNNPTSTPSYILTFPTHTSSEPSSLATPASSITPTPTPTPIPASTPTPTSSFPSSYATFFSLSGVSSYTSTPSPVPTPTSSPTSSPSTSSQSAYALTFATSSSVLTTSSVPNSQAQISSQCPPSLRVAVNAGSVAPLSLLPLMLTVLTIVISSSIGVLVL